MSKLKRYLYYIAAGCGVLGAILRVWTLYAGTDEKGLYPANHPGWWGYLLLCLGMAVLAAVACHQPEAPHLPRPALMLAIGQWAAVAGLVWYGISGLVGGGLLTRIVALAALACAGAMGAVAVLSRKRTLSGTWMFPPCLLALLLAFQVGMAYRGDPELVRYAPQFLAALAAAMAAYRIWGRVADMDNEKKRTFWCALGGMLCIAAAPGGHILYACLGLWLLVEG